MLRIIVAVVVLAGLMFVDRCGAKDLEPVESTKAMKAGTPTKSPRTKSSAADRAKFAAMQAGLPVPKLATGQVGVLADKNNEEPAKLKVVSVVNESNLIAEYDESTYYSGQGPTIELARAASRTTHHYIPVWVKGFSTKGIVDDDEIAIPWVVNVIGTKSYTTADGGKSTVLIVEPRLETAEERLAKDKVTQKKDELRKQKEAAEQATWRTWNDATRAHATEAQFRGLIGDRVKLARRDGTEISVPLGQLCEEDRTWVQARGK